MQHRRLPDVLKIIQTFSIIARQQLEVSDAQSKLGFGVKLHGVFKGLEQFYAEQDHTDY